MSAVDPPESSRDREAKFRAIYDGWFDEVVKWLYALGVPNSDTEDLAQEIFVVVRRKLSRFDGGNLAGWLYRIAQLTARDHRRRAWFETSCSAGRTSISRRCRTALTAPPAATSRPRTDACYKSWSPA